MPSAPAGTLLAFMAQASDGAVKTRQAKTIVANNRWMELYTKLQEGQHPFD